MLQRCAARPQACSICCALVGQRLVLLLLLFAVLIIWPRTALMHAVLALPPLAEKLEPERPGQGDQFMSKPTPALSSVLNAPIQPSFVSERPAESLWQRRAEFQGSRPSPQPAGPGRAQRAPYRRTSASCRCQACTHHFIGPPVCLLCSHPQCSSLLQLPPLTIQSSA